MTEEENSEGKNLIFDYRLGEGQLERLPVSDDQYRK
jgi:hypothetical protein